jgi:hypothetical protein
MEATTGKDIRARIAPYCYGISVIIGSICGGQAAATRLPKSVLHKDNFFEVWMCSPYSNMAAGFLGLVWASLWLLFRFRELRRRQIAVLCLFLGVSAGALVVSLTLLAR